MPKHLTSFLERIARNLGSLFLIVFLFTAAVFALTTWNPGEAPAAAPGDGNVALLAGQWVTSGSDIYYDGGNVGIGTDVPDNKITVVGNEESHTQGRFQNSSGYGVGIGTTDNLGNVGVISSNINGIPIDLLIKAENVGIGEINPVSKFQVGPQIGIDKPLVTINAEDYSGDAMRIKGSLLSPTASPLVVLKGDGDMAFRVWGNGNVGIGEINPNVALDVEGNSKVSGFLRLYGDGFDEPGHLGYMDTISDQSSVFQVGNPIALVGKSSPYHLAVATINADDFPAGPLTSYGRVALRIKAGHNVNDEGDIFVIHNTDADEIFRVNGLGNVGIGIEDRYDLTEKLMVDGKILAQGFGYYSDESLKKDIKPIDSALDKLSQIQGVSFAWKDSDKAGIGLIAQDVEEVFPELVITNPNTGLKSVEYGNLVAPLIEAIKEQQKEIKDLRQRIANVEKVLN